MVCSTANTSALACSVARRSARSCRVPCLGTSAYTRSHPIASATCLRLLSVIRYWLSDFSNCAASERLRFIRVASSSRVMPEASLIARIHPLCGPRNLSRQQKWLQTSFQLPEPQTLELRFHIIPLLSLAYITFKSKIISIIIYI